MENHHANAGKMMSTFTRGSMEVFLSESKTHLTDRPRVPSAESPRSDGFHRAGRMNGVEALAMTMIPW